MMGERQVRQEVPHPHSSEQRQAAPPIANFGYRGRPGAEEPRVLWAGLILLRISAASERVAQSHFVQCLFGYAPFDVRACRMPLVYPRSGRIKRAARPPTPLAFRRKIYMSGITPCLWFDGNAEEAAKFYVSLFHNRLTVENR